MKEILRKCGRPIAWLFVLLIRIYQLVLSPIKYFIFGPNAGCRFTPTCSQYALESFVKLPLHRACYLSVYRILRCNPWGGEGYDPVPGRRNCCSESVDSEEKKD